MTSTARRLAAQSRHKRRESRSRSHVDPLSEDGLRLPRLPGITRESLPRVVESAPARQAEGRRAKPGVGESRGSAALQQPSIVRRATASTLRAVGGPAAGPGMRRQTIPRDLGLLQAGRKAPRPRTASTYSSIRESATRGRRASRPPGRSSSSRIRGRVSGSASARCAHVTSR